MTHKSKLLSWAKLTSIGVICSLGGLFIYHYTQTFAQSTGIKQASPVVHETEISKAVDQQMMNSLPSKSLEKQLDVNPIAYEDNNPTGVQTAATNPPNQNEVAVPSEQTIIQPADVVTKPNSKSAKPAHGIFAKLKKPIVHHPVKKAKLPNSTIKKPATTKPATKPSTSNPSTTHPSTSTPTTKPATKPATKPSTSTPTKKKAPVAVQEKFPGVQYFKAGAKNKFVTQLGYMLVAAGYKQYYTVGPGPEWTSADQKNCQAFQRAQTYSNGKHWTGSDADGYPGPVTWAKLYSIYYHKYSH